MYLWSGTAHFQVTLILYAHAHQLHRPSVSCYTCYRLCVMVWCFHYALNVSELCLCNDASLCIFVCILCVCVCVCVCVVCVFMHYACVSLCVSCLCVCLCLCVFAIVCVFVCEHVHVCLCVCVNMYVFGFCPVSFAVI